MNNGTFKVGEIAIVCRTHNFPENLGQEVEIIEPLGPKTARQRPGVTFWGYAFRCRDGREFVCYPEDLRKRRPPQDWVKLCQLDNLPREVGHV